MGVLQRFGVLALTQRERRHILESCIYSRPHVLEICVCKLLEMQVRLPRDQTTGVTWLVVGLVPRHEQTDFEYWSIVASSMVDKKGTYSWIRQT